MEDKVPVNNHQEVQKIRESALIRYPWLSIAFVMVLYFLFQLIPQLILGLIFELEFFETYPYIPRFVEFCSLALLLLVFVPFVMRVPKNNRQYSDYMRDIQVSGTNFKAIVVGFITTIIVFVCAYGATYLSAWLSKIYYNIPIVPQVLTDPSYLLDPTALLNVYYALTPGIWEEVAFRGIILVLLLKKYKMRKAIIIDGILFGLYHLFNLLNPVIAYFQGGITLEDFLFRVQGVGFQVVYASCLGIAWAYLFVKSKSLIPAIIGHYLIDAFGGLVLQPNIANSWIFFISITLLGIGLLPALIDILIIKGFYPEQKIS